MYSIPRRALALVSALALAAFSQAAPLEIPSELSAVLAEGRPRSADDLRLLQQQVRQVVDVSRPATVAVELVDSVGSGVIVSADGLVMTAGHVFSEPNRAVWLRFAGGKRVRGRSLGVDHKLDAGLVQITDDPPKAGEGEPAAWPFRPIAPEASKPGEWVVGLGQPNGFVKGRAPPVRLGRVLYVKEDLLDTDVTLVGGDSGGPLLNLRGEVVAIHSKIGEAITSNYHIPTTAYQREWDWMLAGRMRGVPEGQRVADWRLFVGFTLQETEQGPLVTQVFADGPAAKAGVAVGDVVVSVATAPVGTPADVRSALIQRQPYERITFELRRGEELVELEIWCGRRRFDFPGSSLPEEDG